MGDEPRGMILDIFKPSRGSASNYGVSEYHDQVTVTGVLDTRGWRADGAPAEPVALPPECQVFPPDSERPAAVIIVRDVMGKLLVHVGVLGWGQPATRAMMGGCYVATSDSRFARLIETLTGRPHYGALALHDRFEG